MRTLFLCFIIAVSGSHALAEDIDIQALTATCATCHGADGMAPDPAWPDLAGQKPAYMATELRAFRDGDRTDPLMSASAQALSDPEIDALAAYYAALPTPSDEAVEDINEAGKNVRALCVSCHGMAGQTVNSEWPNLAGQNQVYLEKQLRAFRDGSRNGSMMNIIAKPLSDQQIIDVAEYYSQLAP